jgi:hypothetical protein
MFVYCFLIQFISMFIIPSPLLPGNPLLYTLFSRRFRARIAHLLCPYLGSQISVQTEHTGDRGSRLLTSKGGGGGREGAQRAIQWRSETSSTQQQQQSEEESIVLIQAKYNK